MAMLFDIFHKIAKNTDEFLTKKDTDNKSVSETVEKLRFSDNLCSDCAEHESSESIKTEAHVPGFYAFA